MQSNITSACFTALAIHSRVSPSVKGRRKTELRTQSIVGKGKEYQGTGKITLLLSSHNQRFKVDDTPNGRSLRKD